MKPILNLNKHPKDCENLSLVEAINVRLSNDGSCLQTEEAIVDIETINNQLRSDYNENFDIIDTISCNKELIIFVKDTYKAMPLADFTIYNTIDIYRYNEDLNIIKKVYSNLNYHNGRIKGTFTYNVHNELIIAFSEYNSDEDVPLRTINLGKFEDEVEQLPNELLPINPEINVPNLKYEYINGKANKGWYNVFIRYKIDNVDYTQWYDIENKILICDINKQNIIKYYTYHKVNAEYHTLLTGAYDYFSTNNNLANETIKLHINDLDKRYKFYQIGIVYTNNVENKGYYSDDININVNEYVLDFSKLTEIAVENILLEHFNLYNSKNLINYKNRLYVSNYKEKLLDSYNTDSINISLSKSYRSFTDLKYVIPTAKGEDVFDSIEISNKGDIDIGTAKTTIVKDLFLDNKTYNTDISEDISLYVQKTENFYKTYIIQLKANELDYDRTPILIVNRTYKICTTSNYLLDVNFELNYKHQFSYTAYFKYTGFDGKQYETKCGAALNEDNRSIKIWILETGFSSEDLTKNYEKGSNIINTKNSFNYRKQNRTFIPGEIYNFYIHFVDKYGKETKGFRINNNKKLFISETDKREVLLIKISHIVNQPYAVVFPNEPIFKNNILNIQHCCYSIIQKENNYYIDELCTLYNELTNEDYIKLENVFTDKYGKLNNENIYWKDVSDVLIKDNEFVPYNNNKSETFFKIPFDIISVKQDAHDEYNYTVPYYNVQISNVVIPEGYIGYFISYEKYQPVSKFTGILTKYDTINHNESNDFKFYNTLKSDYMSFYTSDFDINDVVDLNLNVIRIESKNAFDEKSNPNELEDITLSTTATLNTPQLKDDEDYEYKYIYIDKFEIIVAHDYDNNNQNLGTYLKIPILNELFETNSNIYKASLLKIDHDIYTNNDKELIKCTDIIYNIEKNITLKPNGYITYNNFIVYNKNGFVYNSGDNRIYTNENKIYYGENFTTSKFLNYIQMPSYKDYLYETKEFKNLPQNITSPLNDKEEDNLKFEISKIVEPKNTIDLFENKLSYPDNYILKIYQNNRTDIKYLTQFDKIVRRSDVIQDESSSNAWRQFGLENYKVISENKGKITNIVGIGYYLLVHTEHSLFAFNNDNKLSALDKEIQLTTPDIFDIDYQEMLTSNLGYGGLQNNDDWVLGTFGYIYYDKDSNRIFRFDNGKLDYIDNDIVQFLNKYKPKYIHFADDTKSNRILLDININDNRGNYSIELSYNYAINRFISTHIYAIQKVANTKNNLYLVYNNKINKFDYDAVLRNEGYTTNDSTLSFIINERYQSIKYLEYIIYKLYNVKVNTDDYTSDNNLPPVEELRKPYSGEQIRVYNDEVDTGWLDIHISEEESKNVFANYNKPYWEKGNWNFSYLRDKNTKSRLYGNYFVVSIKFKGLGERIEFESLLYSISKERL